MKELKVVAGIIVCGDEILCLQRGKGKYDYVSFKYEFPGGKIEAGETPVEALQRELTEELEIQVNVYEKDFFMNVQHDYPDFSINMFSYICRVESKEFKLKEHFSYQWLKRGEIDSLAWLPADEPIVKKLKREDALEAAKC